MGDKNGSSKGAKGHLLDWLDATAKLVGAFAILGVAILANTLQSRVTGISIQSQREQAESQLRANMFNSLISPIVGSQKDGKPVPAEREVLLAELLALNFHENFELKPLMEDASERLIAEAPPARVGQTPKSDVRDALWSIARRIAERQKSSIAREWEAYWASEREKGQVAGFLLAPWRTVAQSKAFGCEVDTVTADAASERHLEALTASPACQVSAAFKDTVDLKSPDGNYTLRLWVKEADWKNQTAKVSVQPFLSAQKSPNATDTTYPFTLTWFDLPYTDNTLLPDGNRFAVYLRLHDATFQKVTLVVMWFPKGYFTPRERPLNYREVQELLGRKAS